MKNKKTKHIKNKKLERFLAITLVIIIIVALVFITFTLYQIFTSNKKDTYEVNDENDDGRTFVVQSSGGYGDEYEAWALLQLAPSYSFGVKFDNISVSQGANIVDAYVVLYSVGGPGHDHPNCRIYGDNTDNAVNFSTMGVLDLCGRKYTKNYVLWNTTVPYGKWVKTPSLVEIVQEIINRKNWTSGNSMAVLFVSSGLNSNIAAFRNFDTGSPAKLYIEWNEVD